MTTENIHYAIVMGFLAFLVFAVMMASVLNTRARSRERAEVAASKAREAYWRARERGEVPDAGDEPDAPAEQLPS